MPEHAPKLPEEVVFLQPVVAPSALGLLGFSGSTFLAGAYFAGWIGGSDAKFHLVPILLLLGGLTQFAAGMWAFKARDALAASMHTILGAHWLAFGTLQLLIKLNVVAQPAGAFPVLGWWYLMLSALVAAGAIAATGENVGLLSVLTTMAGACVVMGIGKLSGVGGIQQAAGYVFVVSAGCAWYTALCILLKDVYGRPVLPMGRFPAARKKEPFSPGLHEPGVIRGQ